MSTEIVYIVTQIHIISYIFFVYYFLILLANFHFERVVVSNVKKSEKWKLELVPEIHKKVCVYARACACVCVCLQENTCQGKPTSFIAFPVTD